MPVFFTVCSNHGHMWNHFPLNRPLILLTYVRAGRHRKVLLVQSRSGEEADHGGVMMSFILWNVPCIHMLVLSLCSNPRFYYKNLYLIDSIQNNLLKRDIVNIVILTFGHAYILGGGGICQVFADKSWRFIP